MKSWKVRLSALCTVMALLVSVAGPAMANDRDECRRFHGDLYCEVDRNNNFDNDFYYFYPFYNPFFGYNPFNYFSYNSCGYDWDGPVTPYDCFD